LGKFLGWRIVEVRKEQIYKGTISPSYSSHLPRGSVIRTFDLYPSNLISIDCIPIRDLSGNENIDPRKNDRIVNALKKFDQFHEGLHCEIKSIKKIANNKIYLELKLSNPDTYNYYYYSYPQI
jgi:hypothetical protein